jgi:NAD(P)-dependent dehydrogenase (short-subunit alcohol dehydrogenase family)
MAGFLAEMRLLPPHSLDGILASAGIMALPTLETVEGIEAQFFVNHVAHFILLQALIPLLTDLGRVSVFVC